jgi:molecular chaperone Hsp33
METTLPDRTVRAMTNDGAFRVMTVRSTQTVQAIIDAQGVSGDIAALFGQLITGAVLVRETMSPAFQVQCIFSDQKHGQIIADSLPGGLTRGLVQFPDGEENASAEQDPRFLVTRGLANGETHRGILIADPAKPVSDWLTHYMLQSEQIETRVGVGCIIRDGQVVFSGGYICQELPEAERQAILAHTGYLDNLPPFDQLLIDHDADPCRILELILRGHEHTHLGDDTIHFGCTCSETRVLGALASLGRREIESIVSDGEVTEIHCDYCATTYAIGPEKLQVLLTSS